MFVRIGTNSAGNRTYKLAEIAAIMEGTRTFKLGKKDCKHMAQLKFGMKKKNLEKRVEGFVLIFSFTLFWLIHYLPGR
ncbi:hypothetical protein M1146_05645 [Patescibacteria group bacterium]|nr:hypothetical protein [Patescibacteria group bacterium]